MADKFGNPSLQDALSSFVEGAKEFGLSRAISDAQDQVQQIKMAGLKDAEQRRALGTVAQNLVSTMTGMGANAAQVEQMRLSVSPKPVSGNWKELFANATNQEEKDAALDLRRQEMQEQIDIAKARHKIENPDEKLQKASTKFTQLVTPINAKLDANTAARGNMSKLVNVQNRIADGLRLLEDPTHLNQIGKHEANILLTSVLSQSAPTVSGIAAADVHTSQDDLAKWKSFFQNKPADMEIPELIDYYKKTFGRIYEQTDKLLNNAASRTMNQYSVVSNADPTPDKQLFRQWYGSRLGYSAEDVVIDKNKGARIRPGAVRLFNPFDNMSSIDSAPSAAAAPTAVSAPATTPATSSFLKPLRN